MLNSVFHPGGPPLGFLKKLQGIHEIFDNVYLVFFACLLGLQEAK